MIWVLQVIAFDGILLAQHLFMCFFNESVSLVQGIIGPIVFYINSMMEGNLFEEHLNMIHIVELVHI